MSPMALARRRSLRLEGPSAVCFELCQAAALVEAATVHSEDAEHPGSKKPGCSAVRQLVFSHVLSWLMKYGIP